MAICIRLTSPARKGKRIKGVIKLGKNDKDKKIKQLEALLKEEKSARKFWEIKAAADSSDAGEVHIYGYITSYPWDDTDVSAKSFKDELDELGNIKTLNVYVNSYGGAVFQGQAIYSILKRHSAYKNIYIDGIAASIASLIAMAGDTVYMPENAMMMIHNPLSWGFGNANDLRKEAETLDKVREAMIPAYLNKAGEKLTEEKLIELLDAETWLTAQECLDYGLCDELLAEKKAAASINAEIFAAFYKNIPENIKTMLSSSPVDSQKEAEMKVRAAMLKESKSNLERLNTTMEEIFQ